MNIGPAIKMFRKRNKMTQARLADVVDLSKSYLSLIENGKRKPNMEVVEKIAAALNTTVFALVALADREVLIAINPAFDVLIDTLLLSKGTTI